jgi:1,2-phenylacetyl-CoA epoxidase PaaB subunit
MKSFQHLVLTTAVVLSAYQSATAQQVYRCGSSYSQAACADGVAVHTDDARTEAQRVAASQALASDKALAKEMEASRRKEEAAALAADKEALARAAAAHKNESAKNLASRKAGHTKGRTVKVKEPEFFTATDGAGHTKKKNKPARKSAQP